MSHNQKSTQDKSIYAHPQPVCNLGVRGQRYLLSGELPGLHTATRLSRQTCLIIPKAIEDENRRLKQMYADLSMRLAEESPRKKVDRPSQRREMAETAVERRGVSIVLAWFSAERCRTAFAHQHHGGRM